MLKPGKGRVLVRILPDKETEGDFVLADKERSVWGEVVGLGAPMGGIFTWWEILLWKLTGIHPFKVYGQVLIPTMKGYFFTEDDNKYVLIWQSDIECYRQGTIA